MALAPEPGQKAPEPKVDRIEELASRILQGDILLPKFQRDFVWGKGQITDLLDSIAKNYPIGSVLLWRTLLDMSIEAVAPIFERINSKTARQANLLANLVMLTAASNKTITNRAPSDYLRDVETALGGNLKEALDANLISEAAWAAAKADDYEGFLRERARTLGKVVSTLTGWAEEV